MTTATISKEQMVEAIAALSVADLADLVKLIEERFGVKAQAQAVAVAAPGVSGGGAAGEAASAEEKTEFSAILTSAGDKKIQVIKVIREITGLGLKEAKDLVEGAPKNIKDNLPKAQAEEIKKKLVEVGATVEIK